MDSVKPAPVPAKGVRSRQAILRAAASLATIDGLEGLSIGNLASQIGMSKSGLYAHFASKEELQLATVETAKEIFDADVVERAAGIDDPLARIRSLCRAFLDHIERRVFPGGCFFASVAAEFDTHPGAVRDRIAELQLEWTNGIQALIEEAQARGQLRADEDPASLAFELDSFILTGNTRFVLNDDAVYIARARAAIDRRLDAASAIG
jgi:AcrR family transcriptional regulator